jgi:hypothetical protein
MGEILELVSELALWGSLALLAWGAALCLEETLARGLAQAEREGPVAAGTASAHAIEQWAAGSGGARATHRRTQ